MKSLINNPLPLLPNPAEVSRLLALEYGKPDFTTGDPLAQVVRTVLSQQTTSQNTRRAFSQLTEAFSSWDSLLQAPTSAVEQAIRVAGLAQQKAPRIQQILEKVQEDFGAFSLDELTKYSDQRALDYLLSLPGVGQKTARCVLIFALGRNSIPVDTHVHRLSIRLGWVQNTATAEQTAQLLEATIPKPLQSGLHVLLFEHGRQTCKAQRPKCNQCVLAGLCPTSNLLQSTEAE